MTRIATFLLAVIVTFYFLHARRTDEASLGAFLRSCFPLGRLKNHSTKVDAAIYLGSKFTQRFISPTSTAITISIATVTVHVILEMTHYHSNRKVGPVTCAVRPGGLHLHRLFRRQLTEARFQ
jgi:hypothetical protein